jgi:hypothetical protein
MEEIMEGGMEGGRRREGKRWKEGNEEGGERRGGGGKEWMEEIMEGREEEGRKAVDGGK